MRGDKINISGSLETLLHGLPRDEETLKKFIGLPIKNESGKIIGYIEEIDIDNGLWYGKADELISSTPATCEVILKSEH